MKRLIYFTSVFLAFLALTSCQTQTNGSSFDQPNITEAGKPPAPKKTRKVVGQLPTKIDGTCAANAAMSADTAFKRKIAVISKDCRFQFDLGTGKAWSLTFDTGPDDTARLYFANGPDILFFYFLSDSNVPVDLGKITFSGSMASAEHEATSQNNADGDGMSDNEDTDDDNDGTLDGDEADCDSDSVIDDFELESSC